MVADLLETLRSLGVTVKLVGGQRVRLEPASKIPPELVPRIREAKAEIIAALRASLRIEARIELAAADPAGNAVRGLLKRGEEINERRVVQLMPKGICGHCEGAGFCLCPLCNRMGKGWHGRCVTCGGSGRVQ